MHSKRQLFDQVCRVSETNLHEFNRNLRNALEHLDERADRIEVNVDYNFTIQSKSNHKHPSAFRQYNQNVKQNNNPPVQNTDTKQQRKTSIVDSIVETGWRFLRKNSKDKEAKKNHPRFSEDSQEELDETGRAPRITRSSVNKKYGEENSRIRINRKNSYPKENKQKESAFSDRMTSFNQNQRIKDEIDLKTLKWDFKTPNQDHLTQLKTQMEQSGMNRQLVDFLFDANFKKQIEALDLIKLSLNEFPDEFMQNLDLILRKITLFFHELNPILTFRSIDFIFNLFDNLIYVQKYQLSNYEAESFLPHYTLKLGDPRYLVRKAFRIINRKLLKLYDLEKIFENLLISIRKSNKLGKVECMEEMGFMIETYGVEKFRPENYVKEVAHYFNDKDELVRTTALNLLGVCILKIRQDRFGCFETLKKNDFTFLQNHLKNFSPEFSFLYPIDSDFIVKSVNQINEALANRNLKTLGEKSSLNLSMVDVLSNDIEQSILNILNIEVVLKTQKDWLIPFVDRMFHDFSLKLLSSVIIAVNKKLDFESDHLCESIKILTRLINQAIHADLEIHIKDVDLLQQTLHNFVQLIVNKELKECVQHGQNMLLFAWFLAKINRNTLLLGILKLIKVLASHENDRAVEKTAAKVDFLLSIIYNLFEDKSVVSYYENLSYKNQVLNENILANLNYEKIYYEINSFLEQFPLNSWTRRPNDIQLKAILHLIKVISNTKRFIYPVLPIPSDFQINQNSELEYLFHKYH